MYSIHLDGIKIYRMIKKSLFSVLEWYPINKDIQKIIGRFPLHEYTLFSFYKQNSIFKTKGAFYGNKFSKSSFLHTLYLSINFLLFFNKLFYHKQTNHRNKQRSELLFC